ncbi:MAG: hypothetical protein FJX29_07730 [Alphaproteobacteria bacterium]|nr:hypothetical protein [Alphaproteobacteria bacterium]
MSAARGFDRNGAGGADDREVIHVGAIAEKRRAAATRWGMLLVTFMRICAVLWLALGLLHWLHILWPGATSLEAMPVEPAILIACFAVANVVAAVGLWLAAPWGGVLWSITVVAEMLAIWFFPAYFAGGYKLLPLYALLLIAYFTLSWLAARQRRQM